MKKRILPLAVAATLTFSLTVPYSTAADSLDDEIKELRQQVEEKKDQQKDIQNQLEENEKKQQPIQKRLDQLAGSLEKTKAKIRELNAQIAETERELEQLKKKLQDAEERVVKRDKLLQERVRLMYENGKMSYMEVLFGANDFADFLARFESIRTIIEQDKTLLVEQKRDRDMIADSKRKVEEVVANLNTLQQEAEKERKLLASQQEEQKLVLAGLQQEQKELEEISEEVQQQQRDFAAKLSVNLEEKQRQKAEAAAKAKAATTAAKTGPKSSNNGSNGSVSAFRDTGSTFGWPANGRLSSYFGQRWGRMHKGIDIAAPVGTPLYAAADGVVTYAGPASGYGNMITISHGNGMSTLYGHMYSNGVQVSSGQTVKRGQKIGEVGNAGRSTGPHLHFEILKGNTAVDPLKYLR